MNREDIKILNKLIDPKYTLSQAGTILSFRFIVTLNYSHVCTLSYLEDGVECECVISKVNGINSVKQILVSYGDPEYSAKINKFIDTAFKERITHKFWL